MPTTVLQLAAGTTELSPTCLGHIGFSVVRWKRRKGYATAALELLLPHPLRLSHRWGSDISIFDHLSTPPEE